MYFIIVTVTFIYATVCFSVALGLIISDLESKMTLEKSLIERLKWCKENIIYSILAFGYVIGLFITYILFKTFLLPRDLNNYLKNKSKSHNKELELKILDIKIERYCGKITIEYGDSKFSIQSPYDNDINNAININKELYYIYNNDKNTYSEMQYTIDVIFHNLKYIAENTDIYEFGKELSKSYVLIHKIYEKVKKDVTEYNKETQRKKKEILNMYHQEMDKTYQSLNEFWDEMIK